MDSGLEQYIPLIIVIAAVWAAASHLRKKKVFQRKIEVVERN